MLKTFILLSTITTLANAETNLKTDSIPEQLKNGLSQLSPTAQIKSTKSTPLNGITEVVIGGEIGGEVYYMSNDGEYLIQGNIIETKSKSNITESSKNGLRKETLNQFDKDQRINFFPEDMKHHITVFTDIDCGYCRKLHNQISEYNELGIGVSYLMFPRTGIDSPSYDKAVTVWCSADKNTAMTNAQMGMSLDPIQCDNPVKQQYLAGQASGVNGTPNIITDNGTLIPTYMPPDALLQRLQQLEALQK
jgi:thiol:disulfide interchange protein DsbC